MKETAMTVVSAQGLTKVFRDFWRRPKKQAVSDLSFSIQKGEVFGLLGPNGSGKSTTIKMLLGLLNPTAGRVQLLGGRPSASAIKARVGYLPELSHFHPFLTPRETLRYYGGLFNLPKKTQTERMEALLSQLGIHEAADRPVGEFSKGMARRVGLAQTLLNDPELVILDEPTSGLDPIGRHDVKCLIQQLAAAGKTVLLSSHLLAEVEDVCDRVAILSQGRLCAEGRLADILKKRDAYQLTVRGLSLEQIEAHRRAMEATGGNVELGCPTMSLEAYFLSVLERKDSQP